MKISIAMSTYNGAKYISHQLQSIQAQSLLPDELIISDDCSTDNTIEIVKKFAAQAPFEVRLIINEKNLGYAANFNVALLHATGDLVFLSDQDDVWFSNKIEHMVMIAEHHPNAWMLMNDALLTDKSLNPYEVTKIGQIESTGMGMDRFVMGCCSAVRRELLEFCMPIPKGFKAHDVWLAWSADALLRKYVEHRVLQYYRRHGSNESNILENSVYKVTKIRRYVSQLKDVASPSTDESFSIAIEQLELFRNRITELAETSNSDMADALSEQISRIDEKIECYKYRKSVRNNHILPRCYRAFTFWVCGGYKSANGMKSMLRDLLG